MAGGHNTSFETSFFGIAESSDYIQRVVEYQSFRETRKIKAILATLEAKTAIFQQWNYILQSWTVILCSLMYRWFWPQTWLAKIFFPWEIFDWKQGLNDLTLTNNSVDTNQFDGMNLMGLTAISAGYRKTAQMKKNYLKEQSLVLFWDRFPNIPIIYFRSNFTREIRPKKWKISLSTRKQITFHRTMMAWKRNY